MTYGPALGMKVAGWILVNQLLLANSQRLLWKKLEKEEILGMFSALNIYNNKGGKINKLSSKILS